MEHWEAHFKFYDLFQMNYSKYRFMLDFHRKALKRSFLILDSGAGTGNLTLELLKEKHQVVAIDNNEPALKILLGKCKLYKDNLQIIRQDLTNKLEFKDNSFEGISSSFVIPFVQNIKFYLSENYRVLKNNGIFSISMGLPKKEVMKYIMDNSEKEAENAELIPKYKQQWDKLWETSKVNEKLIMNAAISEKEIIRMLKQQRFKDIKKADEDPYERYVLLLTCRK